MSIQKSHFSTNSFKLKKNKLSTEIFHQDKNTRIRIYYAVECYLFDEGFTDYLLPSTFVTMYMRF